MWFFDSLCVHVFKEQYEWCSIEYKLSYTNTGRNTDLTVPPHWQPFPTTRFPNLYVHSRANDSGPI